MNNNLYLTEEDKEYLKQKGFFKDKDGLYCLEEGLDKSFLISYADKKYKLEFYPLLFDENGNSYEDFSKVYSRDNQTLQQFIEQWI